jgi:hypothetical protein
MTISRKSRSVVNVGVDVGKEMLDICFTKGSALAGA